MPIQGLVLLKVRRYPLQNVTQCAVVLSYYMLLLLSALRVRFDSAVCSFSVRLVFVFSVPRVWLGCGVFVMRALSVRSESAACWFCVLLRGPFECAACLFPVCCPFVMSVLRVRFECNTCSIRA